MKTESWITLILGLVFGFTFGILGDAIHKVSLLVDTSTVSRDDSKGMTPAGMEERLTEELTFRVTAFCPKSCCCGDWSDGFFADGTEVGGKAVAAPRSIPFGTKIAVPGYGTSLVKDRGGAIYDNGVSLPRLDLYFDTHEEALEWGEQELECTIIGE